MGVMVLCPVARGMRVGEWCGWYGRVWIVGRKGGGNDGGCGGGEGGGGGGGGDVGGGVGGGRGDDWGRSGGGEFING